MRRTPKIVLTLAVAAGCIGSSVTANAASPSTPTPSVVAQPSAEHGKVVATGLATAKDAKAAFEQLSAFDQQSVTLAYPPTIGKGKLVNVKQVSGTPTKAVRQVTSLPTYTTAGKHALRCWYGSWSWPIQFNPPGPGSWDIGAVYQGAHWCHDGVKVSANWRAVGGRITWPFSSYVGYSKIVLNVYWEIRLAVQHKVRIDYKVFHIDKFYCSQVRLGDGLYSTQQSCNVG